MRRSRLLLVLTCVAVVACSQDLSRRETILVQQTVEARVNAWVRAMSDARPDSLMSFYDPSPTVHVVWPDGSMAEGPEGVAQSMNAFYADIASVNFAVSQLEVEVLSGAAAQAVFRHSTDVVGRDRQRTMLPGRGVLVLVKDKADKVWKIHTQVLSVEGQSEN